MYAKIQSLGGGILGEGKWSNHIYFEMREEKTLLANNLIWPETKSEFETKLVISFYIYIKKNTNYWYQRLTKVSSNRCLKRAQKKPLKRANPVH